jgi:hypothetical protein
MERWRECRAGQTYREAIRDLKQDVPYRIYFFVDEALFRRLLALGHAGETSFLRELVDCGHQVLMGAGYILMRHIYDPWHVESFSLTERDEDGIFTRWHDEAVVWEKTESLTGLKGNLEHYPHYGTFTGRTVRVKFGNGDIFVDLCHWCAYGTAGLTVIGTVSCNEPVKYAELLGDTIIAPCPWFYAVHDMDATGRHGMWGPFLFSPEEQGAISLLDTHPIIRTNEENPFVDFTRITTVEEAVRELENEDSESIE